MMAKVSTGSKLLDQLLDGGYDPGIVTTIYGPSGSGKTNICLIAAAAVANEKKVIYIDTEGGASKQRLLQLTGGDARLTDNILFLKPTNFKEQAELFNRLKDLINDRIGLVVVDTISMLYRAELGKEVYDTNKILGRQLSYLVEIARKRNIPVLVAAQVYSDFDSRDSFKVVGGDIITYSSKCMIMLKNKDKSKQALLVRHLSLPERSAEFVIKEKGIEKKGLFTQL
jgi:DNA repair protein RadB